MLEPTLTHRPSEGGRPRLLGALATFTMALSLHSYSASAQQSQPRVQSAADVLRSVPKSTDEIEQLVSNLRSPNPSVRVSTFTAMMESNNASLVALALNEAHASADSTMRDLAARAALRQVITLGFEPAGDPESPPELFVRFANDLRLQMSKYDPEHGLIQFFNGQGEISGSAFSFQHQACQGNLAAVSGSWTYEGYVICVFNQDKMRAKLKLTIH